MGKTTVSGDDMLDAILHQPVRTHIVAYLVGRGGATFTELKRVLQVSDGNLESHLKKLHAAGYIRSSKDDSQARQQTLYRLTGSGHAALRVYAKKLQGLLRFETGSKANTLAVGLSKKLA